MSRITRRSLLASAPIGAAGIAGFASAKCLNINDDEIWESYPVTNASRASEFVGASHARIDRVREMLAEDAGLAKAAWDWGFGDWETAIGAASHTGQIEIIELLIAHGARPTVFTLATLDAIDAFRLVYEKIENVSDLEGPHSISLHSHARAGRAERVLEYLESKGISSSNPFEMEQAAAQPYFGTYTWGTGDADLFEVSWFDRMSSLAIQRPGAISRNLIPLGDHTFSPAGARHVRVRFELEDGLPRRLIVPWAGTTIRATRVD